MKPKAETRMITLRAAVVEWPDLRNTKEWIFQIESPPTSDAVSSLILWEKSDQASEYYLKCRAYKDPPFMVLKADQMAPHSTTDCFMLSAGLITKFKLPKLFCGKRNHTVVIFVSDSDYYEEIDFNKDTDIINALERLQKVKVAQPNVLKFEKGKTDRSIAITYSEKVKIDLPYVFNDYTVTYTETAELWTLKVRYKDSKSSSLVEKELTVKPEENIKTQAEAMHKVINAEIGEVHKFGIAYHTDDTVKLVTVTDGLRLDVPP